MQRVSHNTNQWDPSFWIRDWQEFLKKPEEIVFERTIRNISEYLGEELQKYPNSPIQSHERWLIDIVRTEFHHRNLEISLLRRCDKVAINNLQSILNTRNMNRVAAGRAFTDVVKIYHSKQFLDAVEKEFVKNILHPSRSSQGRIYHLTFLLLRYLLPVFSLKYLNDLPEQSFMKTFMQVHAERFRKALKANPQLFFDLAPAAQHVTQIALSNLADIQSAGNLANEIIHDRLRWHHNIERIIMELKIELETYSDLIASVIGGTAQPLNTVLTIPEVEDSLRKFCNELLGQVSDQLTDRLIHYHDAIMARDPNFTHNAYRDRFAAIMDAVAPRRNLMARSIYESIAADTMLSAIHKWYSQMLVDYSGVDLAQMEKSLSSVLFARLLQLLTAEGKGIAPEQVRRHLYRFELKHELAEFILNEVAHVIPLMLSPVQDLTQMHPTRGLFQQHIKLTVEKTPSLYFRSDIISGHSTDMLVNFVTNFFHTLRKAPVEWYVFHEVSELDCNGANFDIGDVTFYDARSWDFGEGETFDPHTLRPVSAFELRSEYLVYDTYTTQDEVVQYRRNSARIRTKVLARDPDMAIDLARIRNNQIISTLVFSNSSGHFGFRPTMPYWVYVTDGKQLPKGSYGKSGEHSATLKIDAEQTAVIDFYQKLMQWQRNETRESLVKALTWYHKGRWEEVDHARFVSYWISLEHLISRGNPSKKEKLLTNIPKLMVTWRSSGDWSRGLGHFLDMLVGQIKSNPALMAKVSRYAQLKSFDEDYAVIIQNRRLLSRIFLRQTPSSAIQQINSFVGRKSLKWMQSEVKSKRDDIRFKLGVIYQKRHKLVHEGHSYSMEMTWYNKALANIVWSTLVVLLNEYKLDLDIDRTIQQLENPLPVG